MPSKSKQTWRLDRLIFFPMLISLLIIWAVFAKITLIERDVILERTKLQLEMMISTFADFNELAEKTSNITSERKQAQQDAMWNVLLRYPTANIWVESQGKISAGQALKGDLSTFITAKTSKETFTVYAALPKIDVLLEWRRQTWQRCGILLLISLVFIVLTQFLARAIRQRGIAEQQVGAAHALLQEELVFRKAAQAALHEHDALLKAVTQSAAELLGTQSHEEAIETVLTFIGNTLAVSWVHLNSINLEPETNHLRSSLLFEWSAPGMAKMMNDIAFQNLNLAFQFHKMIPPAQLDQVASFYTDDLPEAYKKQLKEAQMQSFLYIPIVIDDKLWGSLHFIDTSSIKRQWTWAETDTLKTLAGLIGVTITQMRYIKELANANRQAGMAEIANNVLHNVGNVLNSVNVSANLIADNIKQSKVADLGRAVNLMNEHKLDLAAYLSTDAHGKVLLNYIAQFYEYLLSNQNQNLKELSSLLQSIEHINQIVAMQQAYAGVTVVMEMVDIRELVEDSVRMSIDAFNLTKIEVIREFTNVPFIKLDKHRVLQILVNLMSNAKHACNDSDQITKRVTIRVYLADEHVNVSVSDNGIGILTENLTQVFNYGFTTRVKGHGFGLHNSALSAKEMGGRLTVQSDGLGKGATFTLELPLIATKKQKVIDNH